MKVPKASVQAISQPSSRPAWTVAEDEICREFGHDYKLLMAKLPHRTYSALRGRCQMLGLRRTRAILTAAELSLMRKLVPSASREVVEKAFPGRTWSQIMAYRKYYRLPKRRRPFKRTGIPVIDGIRDRCFELNYSMADLDRIANTGMFFTKANWRLPYVQYEAIGKAVAALGGTLTVRWDDDE